VYLAEPVHQELYQGLQHIQQQPRENSTIALPMADKIDCLEARRSYINRTGAATKTTEPATHFQHITWGGELHLDISPPTHKSKLYL
jgi:hypothetical protein